MSSASFAPTFDIARNTLDALLGAWVFGRVVRNVTRPDPNSHYFHAVLITSKGQRIWFQQSNRASRVLHIGPIEVQPPSPTFIPQAGDVIMGRLQPKTNERKKDRLVSWYANPAQQLQHLANVCVAGTQKHEFQLLHDMRTDTHDEVWALCRLVMFGNIQAFADAHLMKRTYQMRLLRNRDPLDFVYETAETLGDYDIWQQFLNIVPNAKIPSSTSPPPPTSPPFHPSTPPPPPTSPPFHPSTPPPPSSPSLESKVENASKLLDLLKHYVQPEPYDPAYPAY